MIGPFDFFFERHLRFDHGFGRGALDLHSLHKIGELDIGRTGHDHNPVAQGFATGFIKKWNVCEEKFGRCAVPVRFNAPLPANPGMENLFERAFLSRVLEDYRADCLSIQVAASQKNAEPELGQELLFHFVKIDKFPGDLVSVEKLGGGKYLAEALAESALARGNSACNSYCWHAVLITSVGAPPTTEKEKRPVPKHEPLIIKQFGLLRINLQRKVRAAGGRPHAVRVEAIASKGNAPIHYVCDSGGKTIGSTVVVCPQALGEGGIESGRGRHGAGDAKQI